MVWTPKPLRSRYRLWSTLQGLKDGVNLAIQVERKQTCCSRKIIKVNLLVHFRRDIDSRMEKKLGKPGKRTRPRIYGYWAERNGRQALKFKELFDHHLIRYQQWKSRDLPRRSKGIVLRFSGPFISRRPWRVTRKIASIFQQCEEWLIQVFFVPKLTI